MLMKNNNPKGDTETYATHAHSMDSSYPQSCESATWQIHYPTYLMFLARWISFIMDKMDDLQKLYAEAQR